MFCKSESIKMSKKYIFNIKAKVYNETHTYVSMLKICCLLKCSGWEKNCRIHTELFTMYHYKSESWEKLVLKVKSTFRKDGTTWRYVKKKKKKKFVVHDRKPQKDPLTSGRLEGPLIHKLGLKGHEQYHFIVLLTPLFLVNDSSVVSLTNFSKALCLSLGPWT